MVGEKREQTEERFRKFEEMTLTELAIAAATNPESVHAQAARLAIEVRSSQALLDAAKTQKQAADSQRVTAWGTVGLIAATLIVALVTYLNIK